MLSFIAWLVVGGIAGWLASIVMKTNSRQGLVMDIVVGILGGFLAGFLIETLNIGGVAYSGFNLTSIFAAFIGAIVLLGALRLIR